MTCLRFPGRPAGADFFVQFSWARMETMKKGSPAAAWLLALACSGAGATAGEPTERDYFAELPTVLTVTRLAQPLRETPGAVTVIDRDVIRRSGARELADVLRLVPGYLTGGYNGANPTAAYHAPLDDFGVRNLVLIDGRPVYSAYYLGGTARGMMGVLLEDIERIEVLRGSNSAAYGANAMFGVINIVMRDAADTHGAEAAATRGAGGIDDRYARLGWGGAAASFRLSAGRRSDSGYGGAHDDKTVDQLHVRADLRPATDQELTLSAGVVDLSSGEGFARNPGNPERTAAWRNIHLDGQWRRQVSATAALRLTASYDEETLRDAFVYAPDPTVVVSSSGKGRRFNLEFQHQVGLAENLRAVWGAGYKHEDVVSQPLYHTASPVALHEERLFGNLEWRIHPQWLINAGGFAARHSRAGGYFSPRLMANFLVAPDHALRFGLTESTRTPTLFELAGDVRLYSRNPNPLTNPVYWRYAALGVPYRPFESSGQVDAEALRAVEMGYFGNLRDWRMMLDVRLFDERMTRRIVTQARSAAEVLAGRGIMDFVNAGGLVVAGLEYQLRWKPVDGAELWLNQAFQRTRWDNGLDGPFAPANATTLAWFQKLPQGFDFAAIFQALGSLSWQKRADALPGRQRLDLRLAKRFLLGGTRGEAALAVQAANGSQPAYQGDTGFVLERRAFATLRFEL